MSPWPARIGRSRPALTTLAILIALGAYNLWANWNAGRKLTSDEISVAKILAGSETRIHLKVVLKFEPEQFHFGIFQDRGRMVGVAGREVSMRSVTIENARALSKPYWVADVRPWDGS